MNDAKPMRMPTPAERAFRLKRCEEDRDLYRRQRDHADAELARLISGIEKIAGRGGGIVSVDYALEVVGHIKALHAAARAEVERRERAAGELLEELHGVAEERNELHARLAVLRAHLGEFSNATADNDLICGDNGGLLPSQTCVLRRGHRGEHISYGGRRWGPR